MGEDDAMSMSSVGMKEVQRLNNPHWTMEQWKYASFLLFPGRGGILACYPESKLIRSWSQHSNPSACTWHLAFVGRS